MRGSQQNGQQGGQMGQQPGQRGQQPGQSGGEGRPGEMLGPRANGRQGGPGPAWGDAGDVIQNYRETLRELENNPQISKDLRDSIRDLSRLDPQFATNNPELMGRIQAAMLSGVEQVELQLRRMLDDQQGGAVRSDSSEPVPPGYADAVAEYFRRLSKEK